MVAGQPEQKRAEKGAQLRCFWGNEELLVTSWGLEAQVLCFGGIGIRIPGLLWNSEVKAG